MPIPGTDILSTAELAGQMLHESRADTLHAADRARRAEVESERLRELLSIARTELFDIACLMDLPLRVRLDAESAHRNSDPDASTEDVTP